MRIVLVWAALATACAPSGAQTHAPAARMGAIAGTVRDSARAPVRDVRVVVAGTTHRSTTDSVGHYRIDSVPAGTIRLDVWRLGYHRLTRDSVRIRPGRTVVVD